MERLSRWGSGSLYQVGNSASSCNTARCQTLFGYGLPICSRSPNGSFGSSPLFWFLWGWEPSLLACLEQDSENKTPPGNYSPSTGRETLPMPSVCFQEFFLRSPGFLISVVPLSTGAVGSGGHRFPLPSSPCCPLPTETAPPSGQLVDSQAGAPYTEGKEKLKKDEGHSRLVGGKLDKQEDF